MTNDRCRDTERRETNLQTQKKQGGCKDEKNRHAKTIENKHRDIKNRDANMQTKKKGGKIRR